MKTNMWYCHVTHYRRIIFQANMCSTFITTFLFFFSFYFSVKLRDEKKNVNYLSFSPHCFHVNGNYLLIVSESICTFYLILFFKYCFSKEPFCWDPGVLKCVLLKCRPVRRCLKTVTTPVWLPRRHIVLFFTVLHVN